MLCLEGIDLNAHDLLWPTWMLYKHTSKAKRHGIGRGHVVLGSLYYGVNAAVNNIAAAHCSLRDWSWCHLLFID